MTTPGAPDPDATPTEVLPRGDARRPGAGDLLIRLRAQAPLLAVLALAAVAFWRIGLQHWREGTTELGLALLLGAVLRVLLPERTVGLLAVRERRVDVLTYAASGVVVVLVALSITGGPLATR